MIVPRAARQQSQTGIYHVILRGINRQQIFFDDEDSETFIRLLKRFRDVSGFDLYVYCPKKKICEPPKTLVNWGFRRYFHADL